jgi:hypothetical protein
MLFRFSAVAPYTTTNFTMVSLSNSLLALIPISFPAWYLLGLLDSPEQWLQIYRESKEDSTVPPFGSQLLAYVVVALFGFVATFRLIPNIKVRLRKNLVKDEEIS